ncbi:uncharacterized protein LOC127775208 [Oryza glaberrima]|uniref:uncharacterized protein LOC127775208 n=1 Tax=Oryza glaberrima TaxID=4538 RepID=UPI00224C42CA|nr:uncharacterized protein LOC127775208 [Oryza glaberrima]
MQIMAVNTSLEPTNCFLLLSENKDQAELRRSYSEYSNTTRAADHLVAGAGVVAVASSGGASGGGGGGGGSDVETTVRCACCSVTEECTAAYIRRIRAAHYGDWVCGLCAEAVRERMRGGGGGGGVEAALRWHMEVCRDFNSTTRLNPKLSLAGSMRDIARRSFNRRTTASTSAAATCHDQLRAAKTMARTLSCQQRFLA